MKKQIFKVGDKVYDVLFGWGKVTYIHDDRSKYPMLVSYQNRDVCYTKDGSYHLDSLPTLSFTEYTLQGFSQERTKPQPKVGEMCVFWDEDKNIERRVVAILESIGGYGYHENGTYWNRCITLEEFYNQQNK